MFKNVLKYTEIIIELNSFMQGTFQNNSGLVGGNMIARTAN